MTDGPRAEAPAPQGDTDELGVREPGSPADSTPIFDELLDRLVRDTGPPPGPRPERRR